MIGKLVACFAAPLLVSASMPDDIAIVYHPSVVQVLCDQGRGTAWRWRGNAAISVNHVTSMTNCTIGGRPFEVSLQDKAHDFTVLRMPDASPGIPINCGGFVSGRVYYAVGYAGGKPYQRLVTVRASDEITRLASVKGFYVLVGAEYFIPGMSGGVVLSSAGEAVGTINAYQPYLGLSYSTPLSETAVCSHN